MKKVLRKVGLLFFKFFSPRLYYIEKNHADIGRLGKNIGNSTIASNATVSTPAQIGSSIIGAYTYISGNSAINFTTIGKFCSIGINLTCGFGVHPVNGLSTSPIFYSTKKQCGITLSSQDKIKENLPITIGNDVFIGMNVTILDGITIGDGAVIGAGAVVSKDIPPYAIAVGSPIRIVKYRFDDHIIKKLLEIKWWDLDSEQLEDVEKHFFDIESFIKKYDS